MRGELVGLIGGVTLAMALSSGAGASPQPVVAGPELSALSGTWYEVAAYGSWWQRRCVRDHTLVIATTDGARRHAGLRSARRGDDVNGAALARRRLDERGGECRRRTEQRPLTSAGRPIFQASSSAIDRLSKGLGWTRRRAAPPLPPR